MSDPLVAAEFPKQDPSIQFPSEFSVIFQETIIYGLLTDPKFARSISDILEPSYFKTIYLQYLVRLIIQYKKDYKVTPPKDILIDYVKREFKKDKQLVAEVVRILNEMFSGNVHKDGSDYVKENALDFCRTQKLSAALIKAQKLIHSKKTNFEDARRIVQNGFSSTSNKSLTNYKSTFKQRIEAVTEKVLRIPTGLTLIDDDALRNGNKGVGGLPVKKLGIILTFVSGGKSHALVHLGAAAMRYGHTVLHLPLEDDENDICLRYDANLSGISAMEFLYDSNKQKIVQDVLSLVPGKLFIKDYPGRSSGIATIRNHVEQLIEEHNKPNVIIVDYIAEMKPARNEERRHELANLARDLRALAVEYECCVWTAAQSNRSANKRKIVRLDQIGESFETTHPADFVLTLGQTMKDAEEGVCRLFVAKNKNGPDQQVYIAEFPKHLSRFKILKQLDSSALDLDSIGFGFGDDNI
jgi:replicative DNA helicase